MRKHLNIMRAAVGSLLLAIGMPLWSAVAIGGVNYELNTEQATATVAAGTYAGDVTIPQTIVSDGETYTVVGVGESAFAGQAVTSVKLPNTVTTIGNMAFQMCSLLTNVELGTSIEVIGSMAFMSCHQISSVTFPATLREIGDMAYYECDGINKVHIENIAAWCGVKFGGRTSNPVNFSQNLYVDDQLLTNLDIPEGVKAIGNYAFLNCRSIKTLTFHEGLESIGDNCFENCTGIAEVVLPNSVTSVGRNLFSSCYNMTSAKVGTGLKELPLNMFIDCRRLADITVPDNVTTIGENVFNNSIYNHRTTKTNQKYPSVNL